MLAAPTISNIGSGEEQKEESAAATLVAEQILPIQPLTSSLTSLHRSKALKQVKLKVQNDRPSTTPLRNSSEPQSVQNHFPSPPPRIAVALNHIDLDSNSIAMSDVAPPSAAVSSSRPHTSHHHAHPPRHNYLTQIHSEHQQHEQQQKQEAEWYWQMQQVQQQQVQMQQQTSIPPANSQRPKTSPVTSNASVASKTLTRPSPSAISVPSAPSHWSNRKYNRINVSSRGSRGHSPTKHTTIMPAPSPHATKFPEFPPPVEYPPSPNTLARQLASSTTPTALPAHLRRDKRLAENDTRYLSSFEHHLKGEFEKLLEEVEMQRMKGVASVSTTSSSQATQSSTTPLSIALSKLSLLSHNLSQPSQEHHLIMSELRQSAVKEMREKKEKKEEKRRRVGEKHWNRTGMGGGEWDIDGRRSSMAMDDYTQLHTAAPAIQPRPLPSSATVYTTSLRSILKTPAYLSSSLQDATSSQAALLASHEASRIEQERQHQRSIKRALKHQEQEKKKKEQEWKRKIEKSVKEAKKSNGNLDEKEESKVNDDAPSSSTSSDNESEEDDSLSAYQRAQNSHNASLLTIAQSELSPYLTQLQQHSSITAVHDLLDETSEVVRREEVRAEERKKLEMKQAEEDMKAKQEALRITQLVAYHRSTLNRSELYRTRCLSTRKGYVDIKFYSAAKIFIPKGMVARICVELGYKNAGDMRIVKGWSRPIVAPASSSPFHTLPLHQTIRLPITNSSIQYLTFRYELMKPRDVLEWVWKNEREIFPERNDGNATTGMDEYEKQDELLSYLEECQQMIQEEKEVEEKKEAQRKAAMTVRPKSSSGVQIRTKQIQQQQQQQLILHPSSNSYRRSSDNTVLTLHKKLHTSTQEQDESDFMSQYKNHDLHAWFQPKPKVVVEKKKEEETKSAATVTNTTSTTDADPSSPQPQQSSFLTTISSHHMNHTVTSFSEWLHLLCLKMQSLSRFHVEQEETNELNEQLVDGVPFDQLPPEKQKELQQKMMNMKNKKEEMVQRQLLLKQQGSKRSSGNKGPFSSGNVRPSHSHHQYNSASSSSATMRLMHPLPPSAIDAWNKKKRAREEEEVERKKSQLEAGTDDQTDTKNGDMLSMFRTLAASSTATSSSSKIPTPSLDSASSSPHILASTTISIRDISQCENGVWEKKMRMRAVDNDTEKFAAEGSIQVDTASSSASSHRSTTKQSLQQYRTMSTHLNSRSPWTRVKDTSSSSSGAPAILSTSSTSAPTPPSRPSSISSASASARRLWLRANLRAEEESDTRRAQSAWLKHARLEVEFVFVPDPASHE